MGPLHGLKIILSIGLSHKQALHQAIENVALFYVLFFTIILQLSILFIQTNASPIPKTEAIKFYFHVYVLDDILICIYEYANCIAIYYYCSHFVDEKTMT